MPGVIECTSRGRDPGESTHERARTRANATLRAWASQHARACARARTARACASVSARALKRVLLCAPRCRARRRDVKTSDATCAFYGGVCAPTSARTSPSFSSTRTPSSCPASPSCILLRSADSHRVLRSNGRACCGRARQSVRACAHAGFKPSCRRCTPSRA